MDMVEKESDLEAKLVRPLCAKLLPETEAERNGWVDHDALLDISGHGRKVHIVTDAQVGVVDYPCPAGGCLLTSKEFAAKLRDFLDHHPSSLNHKDIALLKVDRRFHFNGRKMIIGRNADENAKLRELADIDHMVMEPSGVPGPVCISERGDPSFMELVSRILCRYSDNEQREIHVKVISLGGEKVFRTPPATPEEIGRWRIGSEGTAISVIGGC